jgi:hypothetical protein
MLAVLHRGAPPALTRDLLAEIGAALPPLLARTTRISAHYLRLALLGAFSELLLAVVDDLARTGRTTHAPALLATGATSGADALAGVVATIHALARPTDALLKDVA